MYIELLSMEVDGPENTLNRSYYYVLYFAHTGRSAAFLLVGQNGFQYKIENTK